jgi:hypothetical protein
MGQLILCYLLVSAAFTAVYMAAFDRNRRRTENEDVDSREDDVTDPEHG